jgi:hypothetical protein
MRFLRPALLLLAFLTLLAGCAGGPPKRVFPPQVTIQELRLQADGQWSADLRIRNFSTVPMTFSRLQATLQIGGQDAARIDLDPAISVGPGSTELVPYRFTPPPAVKAGVDAAVAAGRGTRYRISGEISSSDPGTDDDFDYQSALDPIPGLPGVLR